MLHFLLSQTTVMSIQEPMDWGSGFVTCWDGGQGLGLDRSKLKCCFYLCFVEAVYSRVTLLSVPGSPVMTLIAARDHEMSRLLCSPGLRALFMRTSRDNLLTSWSGSDLSDIRESELNFFGLL